MEINFATKEDLDRIEFKLDMLINELNKTKKTVKEDGSRLIGKREIMAYMGWSCTQWYKQLKNLPVVRIAGNYKVFKSDLENYINSLKI